MTRTVSRVMTSMRAVTVVVVIVVVVVVAMVIVVVMAVVVAMVLVLVLALILAVRMRRKSAIDVARMRGGSSWSKYRRFGGMGIGPF